MRSPRSKPRSSSSESSSRTLWARGRLQPRGRGQTARRIQSSSGSLSLPWSESGPLFQAEEWVQGGLVLGFVTGLLCCLASNGLLGIRVGEATHPGPSLAGSKSA
eukprot:12801618-Alexandrium_andersonii.AAC.1